MSEEEKKEQKKFKTSTKMYFYFAGLAGLMLFIALSAIWDLRFGSFDVKNFISETLILVAIALAAMVLTNLLSEETNKNKLFGVYNLAQNNYDDARNAVEAISVYFSQWYFWYREKESRRKREVYLTLHEFDGVAARRIVAFAELQDVECMSSCDKHYIKILSDGRKVVLPKLITENQRCAVTSVLKGEQDVKETDYADYLFVEDASEVGMSSLERKKFLSKRRKNAKKRVYIMRIIMIVYTALLTVLLTPDTSEQANSAKWWSLVKRFGVFITSVISGWLAGATDVSAQAAIINDKTSVLRTFGNCYEQNIWKPKTQEELDEEALRETESENASSNT